MSRWRVTASLGRAALVASTGTALAVLLGDPVLVVLVAPLALCAALGLLRATRSTPTARVQLDHQVLHEGQGTTSRLTLTGADAAEHVARVSGRTPYVALHPAHGVVGTLWQPGRGLDLEVSPRRWGLRAPAEEKVALTTAWGGWRWGPVPVVASSLRVLPDPAAFDSRAEMPQPLGLVGTHRSARVGAGSELAGIRAFRAGDRLRRVDWRVTLRTGELHVVSTRSEEDSAVLLVVDALADHGRSGGFGAEESSLDLSVRAAAAVARHVGRTGDRVGLRVIGPAAGSVGYGSGERHQQRILTALAGVRPSRSTEVEADRLRLRVTPGTVVVILSPMLDDLVSTLTATLTSRGLPTLVVDTLPRRLVGTGPDAVGAVERLAWRMRRIERDLLLADVETRGCPVVPWRGPGTLDEVLRGFARAARTPRVVAR
ncbi:hypothetical protein I601_1328 [Nocardioides dokdonensis FR1436]|uniref:DUF58 domain-containing protein n=1 Tax=Nocardioides dokdonensis FR1436 TaxID=1300347 RepID=A0A1A9GHI9_9ACTN|nr:DUF58 domain-containing protein [Nocardioides dokdonensis]ANH37767.1 hypothetical protein I601_1328 [Nocardioides dokdonensis FR1436]